MYLFVQRARSIRASDSAGPSCERWVRTAPVRRRVLCPECRVRAGEVAEAIHGVTGSNPRKGNSHTWDDVQAELCDVILTGMVALKTITPDAEKVFAERLNHVAARSLHD